MDAHLSVSPSVPPSESEYRFTFRGTGADLFSIFILNVLKTILTLGVYHFWAKVNTRQYIWAQTEAAGDSFGYHGTGRELLIGWLKATLVVGTLVGLQAGLNITNHQVLGLLLFWAGLFCLIPLVQIGSMRYRLSRTSWRGIRFSFRGDVQRYFLLSLRGLVLSAITVGMYTPFYECETRRYLMAHSRLGTVSFGFDGSPKTLLRIYVAHSLAAVLSIGFMFALVALGRDRLPQPEGPMAIAYGIVALIPIILMYGGIGLSLAACRRRFYWNHMTLGSARFHTTVTTWNLLRLYGGNVLLFLGTLGLATPWITVRSRRYDCAQLRLTGALDLDAIQQDALQATAMGEEMESFLDVDVLPS